MQNFNPTLFLFLSATFSAVISSEIFADPFISLLHGIEAHPKVKELGYERVSFIERSAEAGSLQDPVLKFAIQNLPVRSMSTDESPMSGLEVAISQSFPMNDRLLLSESAFLRMSEYATYRKDYLVRKLKLEAWKQAVLWQRLVQEINLIQGNIKWLHKQLKVSNALFATGKISQRAILEIETRIAELKAMQFSLKAETVRAKQSILYLLGPGSSERLADIDPKTIRVDSLTVKKTPVYQPMIEALKKRVEAGNNFAASAELSKTPDITVGLSYKKRSEIDSLGDFVGAFVTLPLHVGSRTTSKHRKSLAEVQSFKQSLQDLIWERANEVERLKAELDLLEKQNRILNEKSLKFSKLNRSSASKSYGIGATSYDELLSAEMAYLQTLIQIGRVIEKIAIRKIELRFAKGESLS